MVKDILKNYIPSETVWIFGSRVTHSIKPFSDIDLVIINQNPIPLKTMVQLEEAFSESTLPYKVDVLEWLSLQDDFKKIILKRYEVVQ
jgi:predicted nucleotidyltransferase